MDLLKCFRQAESKTINISEPVISLAKSIAEDDSWLN